MSWQPAQSQAGQPAGGPSPASYASHAPQVSPQEYQQIQQWFQAVDTDRSGQININELHRCLSMGGNNFDITVVSRLMMAFDSDRSGEIGLNEFVAMHKYLQAMRESFMFYDRDRSGTLDVNELHLALTRAGYQISQHALYSALPKFDKQRRGSLTFDQYLDVCIYLGNLRKLFHFYDPQHRGAITLTFDQLVASTPYFA